MSSLSGLIRQLLRDVGPMTGSEIYRLTASMMTRANVTKALTEMRRAARPEGRVHITAYVHDDGIGRYYPRAVYAIGPGREPPRPKPLTYGERNRRSAARRKPVTGLVNSVFDLARHL